jgi:F0F1-type ATP synthase membrane subunit b/b'
MTTTETTLVIILIILLSLFFLLATFAAYFVVKILQNVRSISDKAVVVVDNVESAAESLKDASGKFAAFKVLQNIINMTKHKK